MNEIEIRTAVERMATPVGTADATLTVNQVERLLAAATEYAKAQRPIVLHTSSEPAVPVGGAVTAGYAPPRHPGIDVTIPAPPEAGVGWAVLRHRAPQRPGWGLRLAYGGMAATLAGAASAGATDGNAGTVAVAAAGLLATLGGIAQAVTEQSRGQ